MPPTRRHRRGGGRDQQRPGRLRSKALEAQVARVTAPHPPRSPPTRASPRRCKSPWSSRVADDRDAAHPAASALAVQPKDGSAVIGYFEMPPSAIHAAGPSSTPPSNAAAAPRRRRRNLTLEALPRSGVHVHPGRPAPCRRDQWFVEGHRHTGSRPNSLSRVRCSVIIAEPVRLGMPAIRGRKHAPTSSISIHWGPARPTVEV